MILDNKYSNIYFKLVNFARMQPKPKISEKHHIVPKCIGGSNDEINLVYFTPKQHFVAHHLLIKMAQDKIELRKFGRAFKMMSISSFSTPGRPPATTYHIERTKFIIRMGSMSQEERAKRSATFKEKYKNDPVWAERKFESTRKTMATPEYKAKTSIERKSRSSNKEYLDLLSLRNTERYLDPAERQRTSESIKKIRGTTASRAKTSLASSALWQNKEHRKNISDKHKARWQDPAFIEKMKLAHIKGAETRKRNKLLKEQLPN